MTTQEQPQKIQVAFPDHLKGGVYCNNMIITHTKEEFIMDFMMIAPPAGAVTARVIMSPGHMKRTVAALQNNLRKYEEQIGKIEEAPEPGKGKIGFHTA
ncbi:MAG: DUF3467 domain-containing protein [Dehalococcoidales bacterium]|nr:DUF3467 domain-containing protein [Dehalococcoidales bacterium]